MERTYSARDQAEENAVFYEFLVKGIDAEDIGYFRESYEGLLSLETAQVFIWNLYFDSLGLVKFFL